MDIKDVRPHKIRLADLNRFRKVLMIVLESGGGILIDQLRLRYFLLFRYRLGRMVRMFDWGDPAPAEETTPTFSPQVLRELLERLGPTFIKLGQVLSMRADLIGTEFSEELSKLQSDATPFPYEEAKEILKEELGRPPEALYKSFEEKPVAAASLAQVHRAYLKDGTEVAVKIQRPGIQKTIRQDIHILTFLASLTEKRLPSLRIYQPSRVVREFADWTMRELDFEAEGRNAERFRFIFKDNANIVIPKIFWEATTPRVLTMEFSHGVKVTEIDRLDGVGVDRKRLASIGVDAFFKQFFIAGFFHADPHPGNFFAMPDGRLCLHDFGMVGYLAPEARRELLSCLISFSHKDIEGYTKHLLHLAEREEGSDLSGFEKDVAGILSEFFFTDHPPSVAWAFFRVIHQGARRGIRFPSDFALFGKALVTMEGMGKALYPEFDLNREVAPFLSNALKAYFNPTRAWRRFEADLLDLLSLARDLPERAERALSKIERGEIGIKLDPQDLYGMKAEFDRQNDLRILGVVLTAVFLATGGLFYLEGKRTLLSVPLSHLGIALFLALLIWFLIRLRQGPEAESGS